MSLISKHSDSFTGFNKAIYENAASGRFTIRFSSRIKIEIYLFLKLLKNAHHKLLSGGLRLQKCDLLDDYY
jgi:hypothetical protein